MVNASHPVNLVPVLMNSLFSSIVCKFLSCCSTDCICIQETSKLCNQSHNNHIYYKLIHGLHNSLRMHRYNFTQVTEVEMYMMFENRLQQTLKMFCC